MKTFLVSLALAASLGLASAGNVSLNDGGFDYADTDIETAYLEFAYQQGDLAITLSDEPLDGSLPAIMVTVPWPNVSASRGSDILPEYEDLGNTAWVNWGRDLIGFTVTHENAELDVVVTDYLEVMGTLGFDVALENDSMNSETYLLTQGGETIRAIFANSGHHVTAYLRFV